jgi:hypothetical protein
MIPSNAFEVAFSGVKMHLGAILTFYFLSNQTFSGLIFKTVSTVLKVID